MSDQDDQSQELEVPIEWESDEGFHFPLATNLIVNFDSDNFYIRFYQTPPPLVTSEQNLPIAVRAQRVAGVTIPASRMPGFIRALIDNARKYEQRSGEELPWPDELKGKDEI
jgi:hypothetical protein